MECPYCKVEMSKGYLQSSRMIFWGPKKHKLIFIPEDAYGDIEVSEVFWNGSVAESYYCKSCNHLLTKLSQQAL